MNLKKNDAIVVNSSSLMYSKDLDFMDNTTFLAKKKHKLQQIVCIVEQIFEIYCYGMRNSCMHHPNFS